MTGSDTDDEFSSFNNLERLKCPMCQGHGYLDPVEATKKITRNEAGKGDDANGIGLPIIQNNNEKKRELLLPSWEDQSDFDLTANKRASPYETTNFKFSKKTDSRRSRQYKGCTKPRKANTPSDASSCRSSGTIDLENSLIASPKTPKNPQELLKTSLVQLKSTKWPESIDGLQGVVQISRYHPQILANSMVTIYRSVTALLKSFRLNVVRTACQAINHLFINMGNTQRPEFDELVAVLLQKTSDMNKFIRQDANRALDSMVVHVPPGHAVRTLMQKGMTNKNPIVRTATARLLVCTTGVSGVDAIYKGNKDTRIRIMNGAAQSLHDSCQEVRSHGQRLMKTLMKHKDFEMVLQTDVNDALLKRIDKALTTIKSRK